MLTVSGKFQICSQVRALCYWIKDVTQCMKTHGRSVGREMDSTIDYNKEGNLHAESFSSRQLKCHDPWATAGIRCKLMEELPFCVNQEEIKHFFPSGVWTGEQCCCHKG